MSFRDGTCYYLNQIVENHDKYRVPLSSSQRSIMNGIYRYFGAQGVIDNISKYIFDGTYLLLAEDGENLRSRKENIAQLVHGKFWVNNHAHILKNNHLSEIRFLYYLINNMDLTGYVTGSTIPKLSQSSLSAIKVKIPSLPEQKRISDVLASIDEKIELNNKLNKTLEEMAQAIFKSWFVDFEPFKDGEFIESDLGPIPCGWSIGSLGMSTVTSIVKPGVERFKSKKHYLATADVTGTLIDYGSELIDFDNRPSRANMQPKANTVWFAKMKNSRKIILVDDFSESFFDNYILSTGFAGINCYKKSIYYIWVLISSDHFDDLKNSLCNGTTMEAINNENIEKIRIIVPDTETLVKFNEICRPFFMQVHHNSLENLRLKKIRDFLMPKLLSGEIRVPLEEAPHAEVR